MSPAQIHSRESIVDAIREYARIYGRPPAAYHWNVSMARALGREDLADRFYADGCWPHTGSVLYWFGSWNAAIAAAGITPLAPGYKLGDSVWSQKDAIRSIRAWAEAHGAPPRMRDWTRPTAEHPSHGQVEGLFGSWSSGLKAAGFKPRPVGFQTGNNCGRSPSVTTNSPASVKAATPDAPAASAS